MTIRFGGGEYINGPAHLVAQRLGALTTNTTRPFIIALQGDNDQRSYAQAIFLDGDDVEAAVKSASIKEPEGRFAVLYNYIRRLGIETQPGGTVVSPTTVERINRVNIKDDGSFFIG